MWPFGKKKKQQADDAVTDDAQTTQETSPESLADAPADSAADAPAADSSASSADAELSAPAHDAINGEPGPFDGDSVNIEDFDFSEFSTGVLDLGSMRIPLPKKSQVQVEMGEKGPKMLHIVTVHGRMTPVAFAAPRKAGQWLESIDAIKQGMTRDGLEVHMEDGPWGPEVVGESDNGQVRVIGVDGPRWMLRMTTAAPKGKEADLLEHSHEVIARTFVYRGEDPILAGNSLPVVMPKQLVQQVQKAMEERKKQATQQNSAQHPENSGQAKNAQDNEAAKKLLDDLDSEK